MFVLQFKQILGEMLRIKQTNKAAFGSLIQTSHQSNISPIWLTHSECN